MSVYAAVLASAGATLLLFGLWAIFILYATQHARISKEGIFLSVLGVVLLVCARLMT